MGELQSRLKVGVPLGLASILFIFSPNLGIPWLFDVFVAMLGIVLLVEVSRLVKAPLSYYVVGLGLPMLFLPPEGALLSLLIVGATRDVEPSKEEVAVLFSLLMIVGGISSLLLIQNPKLIFACVFSICLVDMGAYFVGNYFKGPKLSSLSPNKTLSGLVGGVLLGSVVFGFITGNYALGIAVTMASVLSDLLESRIKRLLSVKDMGSFLGAHGGFFDRVDSHLGAWIVLYVWT